MKMWNLPLMILVAFILLVPATAFEHPGRIHHRRPPQEPSLPEETEVSYHSEESIPWRTQVTKRKGKLSRNVSCIKSYEFTVEKLNDKLNSTCKSKEGIDSNPFRLPRDIPVVECVNTGCECHERGDYRCTQLITPMEVIMFTDSKCIDPFKHVRTIIKVKSACVCALISDNKITVIKPTTYKR